MVIQLAFNGNPELALLLAMLKEDLFQNLGKSPPNFSSQKKVDFSYYLIYSYYQKKEGIR
jgi:hypothetical protein